jgi:hypothetical protein
MGADVLKGERYKLHPRVFTAVRWQPGMKLEGFHEIDTLVENDDGGGKLHALTIDGQKVNAAGEKFSAYPGDWVVETPEGYISVSNELFRLLFAEIEA